MIKKFIFIAFIVLGTFTSLLSQERTIVVFKDGAEISAGLKKGKIKHYFSKVFKGYVSEMSAEDAAELQNDERVFSIEKDRTIHLSETQMNAPWGLDRIDQNVLPLNSLYSYTYTGNGVDVFIIDSGIYFAHNDFSGRAVAGIDFVGDGQNGNDCSGHGTHVAGIVGGFTFGVAKEARLISARIFDCQNSAQISSLVGAIDWVTANKTRPSAVNVSLNYAGTSPSVDLALLNSVKAGITYVVSSGNFANNACAYSLGGNDNVITVAATASGDEFWTGSNGGTCVDILAPGLFISSAGIADPNSVAVKSGTSMSSPVVAGVVASYLQVRPFESPFAIKEAIVTNGISNVVSGVSSGTPNLLLQSFSTLSPFVCTAQTQYGLLTAPEFSLSPQFSGVKGVTYTAYKHSSSGLQSTIGLERKKGTGWQTVTTANISITYTSPKAEILRWKVSSTNGRGTFSLCYP